MDLSTGIANAFSVLKPQDLDRIVVVYDSESSRVAQAFRHAQMTKDLRLNMKLLQLDEGASKLYRDVPPRIVDEVRAFKPAIAINLLSPDICNVTCRVSLLRIEEELRCKIAHVPEGSEEIFSRYMGGDFQGTIDVNRRVCEYLSAASPAQLRATTERGTSLVIDVTGRRWLTDVISLPGPSLTSRAVRCMSRRSKGGSMGSWFVISRWEIWARSSSQLNYASREAGASTSAEKVVRKLVHPVTPG